MASAGRILIMPKGNYDSSVTYEMLDLVKHNGTSWLAKKTSVGIEPSAANTEYWMDLFNTDEIAASISLDDIGGLSQDKLGQAALSSDLATNYDTPTFVRWNSATLNTPYTNGLTGCVDGFALVYGDSTGNHTVVAWTKGGGTINYFVHQINEGTDIGWETFLKSSGGTLTGDLKVNKSKPRIQMQNTDNSRYAIVESRSEGFTSLGNWKASDDQTNLQLRQPSDGLEEAVVLTVNGTGRYRVFGEHNIELAKSLLGASNLQIQTGNYTGTGSAGSSSPNSITFDFEPKVVLLENGGNVYGCPIIWHKGVTLLTLCLNGSSTSKQLVFEQTGNTLNWYYPVSEADSQLNTQGTVYHWVAIG